MSGVTRYNVRRYNPTRAVSFREILELANSKIAHTLFYECRTPGSLYSAICLDDSITTFAWPFHQLLRHHHLFRKVAHITSASTHLLSSRFSQYWGVCTSAVWTRPLPSSASDRWCHPVTKLGILAPGAKFAISAPTPTQNTNK
ncbi:hypothetical protein AVEN_138506-1 [Araneus ventricosus]|uniref:Uncharacterized protein n=1 Tax=Araneus ventricosus TaxID=182803 RepID=A0A4Y2PPI6_ARAVE|nr:hypothetical protein AVEN_138506-1 [Araneus ventricosus]